MHLTEKHKTILGFLLIFAAMAGGCAANAYAGMWGSANEWNLFATLLYILFWAAFPKLFGNNRVLMKTAYIISICTFVFAVCSSICVIAYSGLLADIFLIPSIVGLVTTVPFYGLTYFLYGVTGKFMIYYPLLAVIALLWVMYIRYNLKLLLWK